MLVALGFCAMYCLLCRGEAGADATRYLYWSSAMVKGSVFDLESEVVSPMGVPMSQWSAGVGGALLVGQLPELVSGQLTATSVVDKPSLTYLAPWLLTIVTWICLAYGFCSRWQRILFGIGIAFVATPLGYYSYVYASETMTISMIAVAYALGFSRQASSRTWDYLVIGFVFGLLLIFRINNLVYVGPMGLVLVGRIIRNPSSVRERTGRLLALSVPSLPALAQNAVVNRWMTGSFLKSTYTFGDDVFKSIDLGDPEFFATLFHPWHGLLVYHPFYVLGTGALAYLIVQGCRRRDWNGLERHVVVAVSAALHLWLSASWYVWWMGQGTFGQRALAPFCVLLVPCFLEFLDLLEQRGSAVWPWMALAVACALWSYPLLVLKNSNFHDFQALASGYMGSVRTILGDPAFVLMLPLLALVFALCPGSLLEAIYGERRPELVCTAGMLGLTAAHLMRLAIGSSASFAAWPVQYGLMLAMMLILVFLVLPMVSPRGAPPAWFPWFGSRIRIGVGLWIFGFTLALSIILVPFTLRTEQMLANGRRADLSKAQYRADIYVPEIRASCVEYSSLASGFERKKRACLEYAAFIEAKYRMTRSVKGKGKTHKP